MPKTGVDAWSISDGYHDQAGEWRTTSDATRRAIRTAMGADGDAPPAGPPLWCVAAGDPALLLGPCEVRLEDGTKVGPLRVLPIDLPLGYHDLQPLDGGPTTRLIVTPKRCPRPTARAWGFAVQLYAVRSARSWGIGDLADLRAINQWAASLGAGLVVINPLHAAATCLPQQPSPYFASSRLWRNVLAIAVDEVPGAAAVPELAELGRAGRALSVTATIERDEIFPLKFAALAAIFAAAPPGPDFDAWRARQSSSLERFATFCALAERHGADYHQWPSELHHPDAPAVRRFAETEADRLRFHVWCQWLLERQLEATRTDGVALVGDLAVGFDSGGADAWAYQDLLATGCRVGAPPDGFNAAGQDWGLPPFVPWKLRAASYQPFIETLRASLAGCGGLRIDHVMGLFRQYWIPPEFAASDGAYVRYPSSELFDILALEATRAGAFVIGEDLGTVEEGVPEELRARQVLSTRLLIFEPGGPETFPENALASVTTHDLPTIAGIWTGADAASRAAVGHQAAEGADEWLRSRIQLASGEPDGAPVADVVVAVHRTMAETPSVLVSATLDDAVGAVRRPNLPGTIDEWPNWRIPLPRTLEQLTADPLPRAVADALAGGSVPAC